MSDQTGLYIRDAAQFHLGVQHATFKIVQFGDGGNNMVPLVGNWDGSGIDKPILYDRGTALFHLGQWDGSTARRHHFGDGGNNMVPLVGNWDGSGIDKPILYDRGTALFHLGGWDGSTAQRYQFGDGGNNGVPIIGNWQPASDFFNIVITQNGRPNSSGAGTAFKNMSGAQAILVAGTVAINVPDGSEAGVELMDPTRPASLQAWKIIASDPPTAATIGTLVISTTGDISGDGDATRAFRFTPNGFQLTGQ